ncbi:hypothetical protein J6590_046719, partial [Homalodisca vitripennis]
VNNKGPSAVPMGTPEPITFRACLVSGDVTAPRSPTHAHYTSRHLFFSFGFSRPLVTHAAAGAASTF